ncbi:MAG: NAD(P)(+) transhydrogenase [Elusimicrobia bacterium GWA2_69_24]|nr:MAG: NAD(P)(+) transhydrogenase [Elusimicrobia bacterium GWA2_69_24]HBL15557.1 Si-specific NAD(P)(+) transhydrogenase [Elusimicrobiota bacterium]
MKRTRYDVVVIGSGPGGEGAAMRSAKGGKSTAVIESYREIGGGCTHWGTIPSKTLRQAAQQVLDFRAHPLFQKAARAAPVHFPDLLRSAGSVIAAQVRMRRGFYERNGVTLLEGRARFVGPHEVLATAKDGDELAVEGAHFVIATGARPYRPADIDFTHPRILDSDRVLGLQETPGSIAIYGAGVVGCEYAAIFRCLGVKVTLVDVRDKLLSFLDDEMIDALSYHLRDGGVILYHGEEYARVEAQEGRVVLHLKSGKQVVADHLLWANGRTGNTDGLGLAAAGLEADPRGNLAVDAAGRTRVPHIFAVGDVVGFPALASTAYDQGRFSAAHILDAASEERLSGDIPMCIYTIPEISSVGKTERELTAARIPYEVGHASFRSLARAQIMGVTAGMLKLLFHRETLEILGVHCFGYQAAEIVHIGQAVMAQGRPGNSLGFFIRTTFNSPTMAEAYRIAALNGLNRLKGIAPRG